MPMICNTDVSLMFGRNSYSSAKYHYNKYHYYIIKILYSYRYNKIMYFLYSNNKFYWSIYTVYILFINIIRNKNKNNNNNNNNSQRTYQEFKHLIKFTNYQI